MIVAQLPRSEPSDPLALSVSVVAQPPSQQHLGSSLVDTVLLFSSVTCFFVTCHSSVSMVMFVSSVQLCLVFNFVSITLFAFAFA